MDVGTHLRAIWRRRVLVLGGALLVGLAVFGVRAATPDTYVSSALLFVVPGGGDAADAQSEVRRLGALYANLTDDERVLSDAAAQLPGVSAAALAGRVTVQPPDSDQLAVVVTGPTAEEAADAANAVAQALSEAAERQEAAALADGLEPLDAELAELDAQLAAAEQAGTGTAQITDRQSSVFQSRLDRLSVPQARLDLVSAARPDDTELTPSPVRDGVLAFLLGLIILSELVALVAARRAGLDGRDPLPVLRDWSHLPAFRAGASRRGPGQSAGALLHAGASEHEPGPTSVIALAPLAASTGVVQTVLRQVISAGIAVHGQATVLDLRYHDAPDPGPWLPPGVELLRPSAADPGAVRRALQRDVDPVPLAVLIADEWDAPELLLLTRALRAATLLVVDSRTVRRPALQEAVTTLQDLRTPASGVVVLERFGRGTAALDDTDDTADDTADTIDKTDHKRRTQRRRRRTAAGALPTDVPAADRTPSPSPASTRPPAAPPTPSPVASLEPLTADTAPQAPGWPATADSGSPRDGARSSVGWPGELSAVANVHSTHECGAVHIAATEPWP